MSQNNHHRPLMVQAPVRALDADGLAVVTAGTVGFLIGVGVCWWNLPSLVATGRGWYLGVAITGTAIGLIGLAVGLTRKVNRARTVRSVTDEPSPGETKPGHTAAESGEAPNPEGAPAGAEPRPGGRYVHTEPDTEPNDAPVDREPGPGGRYVQTEPDAESDEVLTGAEPEAGRYRADPE